MTEAIERFAAGGDVDGLEDVDDSDLITPILRIKHSEGVFEDGLTGEKIPQLYCILLGLVKQRVLWPADDPDAKKPNCQSVDFKIGRPVELEPAMIAGMGFSKEQIESGELPCSDCGLKEWESHPDGKRPWCAEQFTFPLIRLNPENGEPLGPAVISFQKTQLKPSRRYVSAFQAKKVPLYSALTLITLDVNKRGTTIYSVPKYELKGNTDPNDWDALSMRLKSIREFLHMPRRAEDIFEAPDNHVGNEDEPTPEPTKPNTSPPMADDESDPF